MQASKEMKIRQEYIELLLRLKRFKEADDNKDKYETWLSRWRKDRYTLCFCFFVFVFVFF